MNRVGARAAAGAGATGQRLRSWVVTPPHDRTRTDKVAVVAVVVAVVAVVPRHVKFNI